MKSGILVARYAGNLERVSEILLALEWVKQVHSPLDSISGRPRFDGYLFVEYWGDGFDETWSTNLKEAKIYPTRRRGKVYSLTETEITKLFGLSEEFKEGVVEVNQHVELVSGMFKGYEAKVKEVTMDKVKLEVVMSGGSVTILVDLKDVRQMK